jgi:hypothetical protein
MRLNLRRGVCLFDSRKSSSEKKRKHAKRSISIGRTARRERVADLRIASIPDPPTNLSTRLLFIAIESQLALSSNSIASRRINYRQRISTRLIARV